MNSKPVYFSGLGFLRGKMFQLTLFCSTWPSTLFLPFPPLPDCSKKKILWTFFFSPTLVTVIYISSPFHCFSPWIRQACSNLRFTLKVTESPLTWQRLCMTRAAVLGGDPLAWTGAFNLGDASKLGGICFYFFSPFIPSDHPEILYGRWIRRFSGADGFPWGWSLKDSKETSPILFNILEVEHKSVFYLNVE